MTSHRISHLAAALAGLGEISRSYTARVKTGLSGLTTNMSSVDGSRVARGNLTCWRRSGAVFCPAC
jgi:hypothetical protein